MTLPDRHFLWEERAWGLRPMRPLRIWSTPTATSRTASPDYLPVASVSGGILALKVKGERRGSVWFWADDDPRASNEDTPADT